MPDSDSIPAFISHDSDFDFDAVGVMMDKLGLPPYFGVVTAKDLKKMNAADQATIALMHSRRLLRLDVEGTYDMGPHFIIHARQKHKAKRSAP